MQWRRYRLVPRLSQNFRGSRNGHIDVLERQCQLLGRSRRLSSRPEAFFTSLRLSEIFRPNGLGHDNPFHYQLTDLTFWRQVNMLVTRVIKEATNLAAVVRIDNTRENVQSLLYCQP